MKFFILLADGHIDAKHVSLGFIIIRVPPKLEVINDINARLYQPQGIISKNKLYNVRN
jgi:hypothetical protein